MIRRIMIAALASAALALPGAAHAGPGKSKAAKSARTAHKATARANSMLRGTSVVAGPLTGLDPGDAVYGTVNGSMQQVGSVERIVPRADGRVGNVLVRTVDGRILPLSPGSLSLDSASGQWTAVSLRPNSNRAR